MSGTITMTGEEYDALRAENERLTREQGEGTTSNKYRAELYDEVWERAREMGFENVTMALAELAALRQPVANNQQAEREAFEVWAGENHFGTRRPFANANNYESGYTDFCWKAWQARAALSAPAAGQDVSALVEALPFVHKIIAKLRRFDECASDSGSGGVDIGRHWLDLLTQLGLLIRTQRSPGMWEMSQQGEDALAAHKAGGGDHE